MAKQLVFQIKVLGVSSEAKRIAEIDKQLEQLNKERRESLKLNKDQKKLTDDQVKKTAALNTRIKGLREEKTKLNRTETQAVKAFRATAGSMEALRIKTAQLRKEANQLNRTTVEGKKRYQEIRKEVDSNAKQIRDFDRDLSGSKTLVGEYSKGFTQAFGAITTGILAAVAAFRTFNRVLGGSIKEFADFEQGQLNVQTLLDDFNQSLSKDSIRLITQYGLAVEDLNKATFDAVSGGREAGEVTEFLGVAAKLAIGGVTDITTTVGALNTVINAYRKDTSEAERIASAFFTAQKFGLTTVQELAQEIGQVIPVATQMNVQYEDLLALYAKLTAQGIKTNLSTTAIRATLTALLNPAKEAADVFDKLGIAYGATNVEQRGFLNVMGDIAKAVEDGDTELVELIPNVRALIGAGALTTEALKDTHEILEVIKTDFGEGSSLSRAFELQMESTRKALNRIKVGFKETFINVGEIISPAIKLFADLINPIETTTDKLEDQRTTVFRLTAELSNANIEEARKLEIMEELEKIYPDLLKNIDQEAIDTATLAENVAEYNRQIAIKIAMASLEEEQQKILGKQGLLLARQTLDEGKAVQVLIEGYAELVEQYGEIPDSVAEGFAALEKLTRNADISREDRLKQEVEIWKGINDALLEVDENAIQSTQGINSQFTILAGSAVRTQEVYRTFVDKNKDALEELSEAQRILAEQLQELGTTPITTPTPTVTPTPGDGGARPESILTLQAEIAKLSELRKEASLTEIGAINDEIEALNRKIQLYQDASGLVKVTDEIRIKFTADERALYDQLLAENEAFLEETVRQHEDANADIFDNQLRAWQKETEAYRKKEADKQAILQATDQILNQGLDFLFVRNDKLRQQELDAAGDNAEKKDEINKKFAKKEKAIAISSAIINTALAVTKVLGQTGILSPFVIPAIVASGALQVATILAQKFASGGLVQTGRELPGSRKGTDNTLALLTPGEAVVNKSQQSLLGGPDAMRRAGVPGFAAGGLLPEPNTASIDARVNQRGMLREIRVVQNINELNAAQEDLAVVQETSGL